MNYMKPDWQYANDVGMHHEMSPDHQTQKEWPDRTDAGMRVEIEYEDGRMFTGRLEIEDTVVTGEDELPLFVVIDEDGRRHGFSNNIRWHFVGH